MSGVIDFDSQVKELSQLVRNLNNKNDEVSRAFAINKAQIILCQYKYDMHKIDSYAISQFFPSIDSIIE